MEEEKMMGVVRHILTALGSVFAYVGFMDETTWLMVSGAMATLIAVAWSWKAK